MGNVQLLSRIKGGMLGGAVGDSLGGIIEFFSEEMIFKEFGPDGITDYVGGKGYITDDTQMSLFTADGLIKTRKRLGTGASFHDYLSGIYESYLDWYYTQTGERVKTGYVPSALIKVKELYKRRAPGNTCLFALACGKMLSIEERINNSKGCGGIMRIAPIAFFFYNKGVLTPKEADMLAASASALTHGHELGYIPSAALCDMLCRIQRGEELLVAVEHSLSAVKTAFPDAVHMDYFISLIQNAVDLSQDTDVIDDLDAIRELGQGWVAEETLAIAVYCALKYKDDFEKAVVAAVNHGGDSDSTGAVTGNIVGTYLGVEAIPKKYLENLELRELMNEIAGCMLPD